jgi:hypothetical protein
MCSTVVEHHEYANVLFCKEARELLACGTELVPQVRIELTTYPLPRDCATTTLLRQPWHRETNSHPRVTSKVRCYNVRISPR